jgi:DHA3 family macrolide efflux protein-like MFS transporter
MENTAPAPKSLKTFLVIWFGQLISVIGSGLTGFALGVWIYDQTGQATPFAVNALFATLPNVLLMPIAGALADRFNRRRLMMLADSGAAAVTGVAAVMLFFGDLQVWHIYLISLFGAFFSTFQYPAYMASITMLVPKKDLARAGGLMQMGGSIQSILTPLMAGALYAVIGLRGVIMIDAATFAFAVGTLLVVRIPQPKRTTDGAGGEKRSLLADAVLGWNYLRARPGLFGMLLYFASVNFFLSFSGVLSGPLVLSFGSSADLGVVQMAGGVAMLVGSLAMSAWGGPRRRVPWLIVAIALASAGYLVSGAQASTPLIAAGRVILLFFIPFAAALSQAVFQTKVPADLQGRVFAIRGMIATSITPLAFVLAGPLADRVFEPMMRDGGGLGGTFLGDWLGVGPGRGIGLMYVISCLFLWVESGVAFASPRIRRVEDEIPDAIPDEPAGAEAEAAPAPAEAG